MAPGGGRGGDRSDGNARVCPHATGGTSASAANRGADEHQPAEIGDGDGRGAAVLHRKPIDSFADVGDGWRDVCDANVVGEHRICECVRYFARRIGAVDEYGAWDIARRTALERAGAGRLATAIGNA